MRIESSSVAGRRSLMAVGNAVPGIMARGLGFNPQQTGFAPGLLPIALKIVLDIHEFLVPMAKARLPAIPIGGCIVIVRCPGFHVGARSIGFVPIGFLGSGVEFLGELLACHAA